MTDNPILGSIILFAGNFAPKGWAFCEGQLLSIAQNNALYSLIYNTYGGDGKTNFALPDLRGRAPIHFGQGVGLDMYKQGQSGGSEVVVLNLQQLPAHNHSVVVQVSSQAATSDDPAGNVLAKGSLDFGSSTAANGRYGGVKETTVGSGQPVSVRSPYLALNYIIAIQGIYPSQF
jgi:microcystin-dependent protein